MERLVVTVEKWHDDDEKPKLMGMVVISEHPVGGTMDAADYMYSLVSYLGVEPITVCRTVPGQIRQYGFWALVRNVLSNFLEKGKA